MSAQEFIPPDADTLDELKAAATGCKGCELWENATQTVFGRGAAHARVVFVGEQPGDVEDREGLPFVGPAGRLLDQALEQAGIDREQAYLTNAVKHFRFRGTRGKRRIHQTPTRWQVAACQPWLLTELELLAPEGLVVLGASAGVSLFGPSFRVGATRGRLLETPDLPVEWAVTTVHPSAVLRAEDRATALGELVADLEVAAKCLAG